MQDRQTACCIGRCWYKTAARHRAGAQRRRRLQLNDGCDFVSNEHDADCYREERSPLCTACQGTPTKQLPRWAGAQVDASLIVHRSVQWQTQPWPLSWVLHLQVVRKQFSQTAEARMVQMSSHCTILRLNFKRFFLKYGSPAWKAISHTFAVSLTVTG